MRLNNELGLLAENFAALIEPVKQATLKIFGLIGTDRGHGVIAPAIQLDDKFDGGKFGGFHITEATPDGGSIVGQIPDGGW